MATFEQLYTPVIAADDAVQAKNYLEELIRAALARAAWEDTPNNRERATYIVKEEIEFISQYESARKAEQIRRLFLVT
jgi:polyhydroxyalkanoate synthesis regulator phasin